MNTNKEPKTVDWSKQKPGTIGGDEGWAPRGVYCRKKKNEGSMFHSDIFGWSSRMNNGRVSSHNETISDILLPWESCIAEGHNPDGRAPTSGVVWESGGFYLTTSD